MKIKIKIDANYIESEPRQLKIEQSGQIWCHSVNISTSSSGERPQTRVRVRVRAPEPAQGSSHLLGSGATHSAITDTQFPQAPKSLRHRFPRRSEPLRRRTETRMFRVTPDTRDGIFGDVLSRVGPKVGSAGGMRVSHTQWKSCESTASQRGHNSPSGGGGETWDVLCVALCEFCNANNTPNTSNTPFIN